MAKPPSKRARLANVGARRRRGDDGGNDLSNDEHKAEGESDRQGNQTEESKANEDQADSILSRGERVVDPSSARVEPEPAAAAQGRRGVTLPALTAAEKASRRRESQRLNSQRLRREAQKRLDDLKTKKEQLGVRNENLSRENELLRLRIESRREEIRLLDAARGQGIDVSFLLQHLNRHYPLESASAALASASLPQRNEESGSEEYDRAAQDAAGAETPRKPKATRMSEKDQQEVRVEGGQTSDRSNHRQDNESSLTHQSSSLSRSVAQGAGAGAAPLHFSPLTGLPNLPGSYPYHLSLNNNLPPSLFPGTNPSGSGSTDSLRHNNLLLLGTYGQQPLLPVHSHGFPQAFAPNMNISVPPGLYSFPVSDPSLTTTRAAFDQRPGAASITQQHPFLLRPTASTTIPSFLEYSVPHYLVDLPSVSRISSSSAAATSSGGRTTNDTAESGVARPREDARPLQTTRTAVATTSTSQPSNEEDKKSKEDEAEDE